MNLEELAAAAGFDVEPNNGEICHPFTQADGDPCDQRDLLTRFAALVLEEAAKKADEQRHNLAQLYSWPGQSAAAVDIGKAIRAMKPVAT